MLPAHRHSRSVLGDRWLHAELRESVAAGGRARRSPRCEAGVLRWPDRVHGGVRCMRASPNVPALIGARIMQGVGAALFMPSSLAILGRAYTEPRQRAQAIGIWSSITAIAGASGPVLGGLLVATLGWRSIFLLNVPLGVLGLAMAVRFIPATSSGKSRNLADLLAPLIGSARPLPP